MAAWELVDNTTYGNYNLRLERLTVPGGWFVRYSTIKTNTDALFTAGLVFLEDVSHTWVIGAWASVETETIGVDSFQMDRMSVPGGWLVRMYGTYFSSGNIFQYYFSFLPDASHIWSIVAWELATTQLIAANNIFFYRMNIPGGWYTRNLVLRDLTDNFLSGNVSFLDDASHIWTL